MWTYGGIRIFVTKRTIGQKQVIAELQPLRAGSIYQVFGWEDQKDRISCVVVGNDDLDHLKSLTTSGEYFELTTPEGETIDYYLKGIEAERVACISQTLRQDLECDSPVYNVDLELVKYIA